MHRPLFVLAVATVLAGSAAVHAAIVGDAITITATNGTHTATYTVAQSQLNSSGDVHWGGWNWPQNGEYEFRDPNDNSVLIGKLSGLSCFFQDDPVVSLGFSVISGPAPTVFTITSALLSFPPDLYTATGSAAVTLTDNQGNGALFAGLYGGFAYEAYCNGLPIANLIPTFGIPSGSDSRNGAFGPIAKNPAQDMQASFRFQLSAFDSASGTSTFTKELVPAPGAAGLLGLGGLLAARRRRA